MKGVVGVEGRGRVWEANWPLPAWASGSPFRSSFGHLWRRSGSQSSSLSELSGGSLVTHLEQRPL